MFDSDLVSLIDGLISDQRSNNGLSQLLRRKGGQREDATGYYNLPRCLRASVDLQNSTIQEPMKSTKKRGK